MESGLFDTPAVGAGQIWGNSVRKSPLMLWDSNEGLKKDAHPFGLCHEFEK